MQLISNKSYAGGYSLHYEVNMWVTNQSIEGNYSDVFWSVDLRGGQAYQISSTAWAKLVINGEQVWSRGSGTYRAGEHNEGIKRIYHNDVGEATCTARLDGKIVQNISTGEQSMTLASIPRKAVFTNTIDLTEDSSEIVFEYSNPAGNYVSKLEFTIHLTGIEESHLPWIDLNKTGYKRAFKFTEEYKEIFRKYIGNKKENQVTYVLKTTIGDKAFYDWSRKNFKLTKTSAPTLTGNLSYINLDKTLPNNNVFNFKNNININFAGKATAKTGTSIKSLNLKIENKTIINSPDNFTFNVGFIKTSGKVRGELVAVDSRGMESNKLITYINVYPYTRPTVFLKAKRKNNFEDETSIDISGKIQSIVIDGKELNAVQVIQYWTGDNEKNKGTITNVKVNPDGTFTIPTIWKNYPKTEKKIIYVAIRDKYTFLTADAVELARGQAIFRISTADNKLYNNEVKVATINDIYPVGSIFITTNNTNPSTYFGGKWEKFAKGKTLVGLDDNDSDFNKLSKTGGAKKHKLTTDEMPRHYHKFDRQQWFGADSISNNNNNAIFSWKTSEGGSTSKAYSGDVLNTGGNKPHNNLQPYIVVNMWRRIK